MRHRVSAPILKLFKAWLKRRKGRHLSKSHLGKAVGYLTRQWISSKWTVLILFLYRTSSSLVELSDHQLFLKERLGLGLDEVETPPSGEEDHPLDDISLSLSRDGQNLLMRDPSWKKRAEIRETELYLRLLSLSQKGHGGEEQSDKKAHIQSPLVAGRSFTGPLALRPTLTDGLPLSWALGFKRLLRFFFKLGVS